MNPKRFLLGLILAILLTSCAAQPVQPTATSTSTPTLPPGVTPSETPSPTLTPSPTPIPEVRVENGEKEMFNGDYESAYYDFLTALNNSSDSQVRAAALWGLGRVEHILGNNNAALDHLSSLSREYPDSPNAGRAYFLAGEIYDSVMRYTEAAQAYASYLTLRPGTIDYYAEVRRGDALSAAGNYTEAITAYQAALNAPHIGDDTTLKVKLAQTYINTGDNVTALGIYDAISANTQDGYVKAQMDLLSGRIYYGLGQTDQTYQKYLDAVDNYPASGDSYSALVVLVNDGVPVDDLSRGLVDYFAGQDGYALEAFNRYIAANPKQDGTANYYIALTLADQGEYQQAVDTLTDFIVKYPDHRHWTDAWIKKYKIQWQYLDQYEAAAQTLHDFIAQTSDPSLIPSSMQTIGKIYDNGGFFEKAASAWEALADAYPGSNLTPQALFQAGIDRYRIGQYPQALVTFQRDVLLSTDAGDQARAYYWIGKCQQISGDAVSAQASWRLAVSLDPSGYYGLRAQDMLLIRPVFEPPTAYRLDVDLATERLQAEAWLRVTFSLPPETALSGPGALASDPRLVRGTELWNLGLFDEARLEFEDLRVSVKDSAADSFRLANYLLGLGAYRLAINTIELQVLPLAGMNTYAQMQAAPVYFKHVRFGAYFGDLVVPAAQQDGFDPLFLFSVIRQESLFESFATSSAAAQGLMQITPDTGQFIVDNLGWPLNYTSDDLNRPLVSITLGAYYLKMNQLRFGNDLYVTLTAYNGGPNNPQIPVWQKTSSGDPDLFVEIEYGDIGNYIRDIYEIYCTYRSLYGAIP